MKNSDLISVTIIGFGFGEKKVEVLRGSKLKDLVELLGFAGRFKLSKATDKGVKEVNFNIVLNDEDVFVLTTRLIGEASIKCSGRKWIIHMSDKDPRPSDFHAHDYDNNQKLDLLTGYIFNSRNKLIGKFNKKYYKFLLKELTKHDCFKKKAEEVINRII